MAATTSPTSLQLRLALNCRNGRGSSAVLVYARGRKLDHCQFRLFCAAQNGNRVEQQRQNGGSWKSWSSVVDNFAGWSDSDNDDQSVESQKKKWLGGTLVTGLAGIVIVSGLTFAALSLSKRNTTRTMQQIEALTTEQEVSLASGIEDHKIGEQDKIKGSTLKLDDGGSESKTGVKMDLSMSTSLYETPDESKLGDNNEILLVDNDTNKSVTTNNVSIQDGPVSDDKSVPQKAPSTGNDSTSLYEAPGESKLGDNNEILIVDNDTNKSGATNNVSIQDGPVSDDVSVHPEMTPSTGSLSSSEIIDSSLDASSPSATSEIEQNLDSAEGVLSSNTSSFNADNKGGLFGSNIKEDVDPYLDSSDCVASESRESVNVSPSVTSFEPEVVLKDDAGTIDSVAIKENLDLSITPQISTQTNNSSSDVDNLNETESPRMLFMSESTDPLTNEQDISANNEMNENSPPLESLILGSSFSSAGVPAPSVVSPALQVSPGKVLVPAVVDPVQGQALAAFQILKVIEPDAQPSNLCTRREYARWLVSASGALSRNMASKVYPAMYIEDITELAFDDITPDDPDFSSIQGLAEAGIISSKLSSHDLRFSSDGNQGPFYFSPESSLSRQDLVSWKMALEKRQLPEADRKILYQLSGFRDIDRINPDAWPALIADLSAGDQGIISHAFGCTRLFQPDKPVTKGQAAVALATGEASDVVSEELARIEAESLVENAFSAHNALVAQVEKDINASFEKNLSLEREKTNAVEKMAEEAKHELERLRADREEDNLALMKERAAIEAEMEVLSRLRREVEGQLQSLMSDMAGISYEKERISKLQQEAENEKQEISRLQYDLEVERKALSMARAWAEDEAKRAREQAKALEEAREHWEKNGIKVVVDSDLRDESSAGVTWATAGKEFSVEGTVSRGENLVDKLKLIADSVKGKSKEVIHKIMEKVLFLISILKQWVSDVHRQAKEFKDVNELRVRTAMQELQQNATEASSAAKEKARGSVQEFQATTAEFTMAVKEGAKRVAGDCMEGVEKFTQKFKS